MPRLSATPALSGKLTADITELPLGFKLGALLPYVRVVRTPLPDSIGASCATLTDPGPVPELVPASDSVVPSSDAGPSTA